LITKWNLSPLLAGAMASILFIGLLVGTISGGFACDSYGRRGPILVTYLGIAVFIFMGILSPGTLVFIAAKFMLGFFLGFGVPAANAIVAETCPPAHRANIYCMTMVLFSLGQLYSATIVWIMLPTLHHDQMQWRLMLSMATLLPLVLFVLAYLMLLESPHWLVANKRMEQAKVVLWTMSSWKTWEGDIDATLDFEDIAEQDETGLLWPPPGPGDQGLPPIWDCNTGMCDCIATPDETTPLTSPVRQHWTSRCYDCLKESNAGVDMWRLRMLFSPSFRTTTIIMLCITFASNFAYYGMIYGLPDTLKKQAALEAQKRTAAQAGVEGKEQQQTWSPAAGVFFSAAFEIPGVFIAIILGMTVGRRKNMSFAFFCTSASLALTVYALSTARMLEHVGIVSVLGVKLFLATGYIIVYLYLLECYPTKFRATGLAFCMVLGRLGAFAVPFTYDGMELMGIHQRWFFVAMSFIMLMASIACCFLPYETKDAELEGAAPPTVRSSVVMRTASKDQLHSRQNSKSEAIGQVP